MEHGEAVVMAGGDTDVLCAGSFHIGYPFLRVELGRVKAVGQLGILLPVDVLVVHDPLAIGHHAIDSPMDEYPELHVLELGPVFQVFRCRHIVLLCRNGAGHGNCQQQQ